MNREDDGELVLQIALDQVVDLGGDVAILTFADGLHDTGKIDDGEIVQFGTGDFDLDDGRRNSTNDLVMLEDFFLELRDARSKLFTGIALTLYFEVVDILVEGFLGVGFSLAAPRDGS